MAGSSDTSQPSLLPYVQGMRGGHPLHLSLFEDSISSRDRAYPFMVVDDANCPSRIVHAQFVTDTGALLKNVFLLMQNDHYTPSVKNSIHVTNTIIDMCWQETFLSYQSQLDDGEPLTFSSQTDSRGHLAQMAPLFFCREKRLYFHPVCTLCGLPLQLCIDEDLLRLQGLHSYSGSFKRYLYCPTCCSSGEQIFYLYERDATDPVTIRDRWSLIDGFRFVSEDKDSGGEFPCSRCTEHQKCFGPSQAARARITPFSFYPFFVLVYDAPQLHMIDFLYMLSGASFEELEACLDPVRKSYRLCALRNLREKGLLKESLVERLDNTLFLDLLAKKLELLASVLSNCISRKYKPELSVNIHRMWVDIASTSLNPSRWFVNLVAVDDVPEPCAENDSVCVSLYGRLGTIWFQVLLLNSKIRIDDIILAVNQYVTACSDGVSAFEKRAELHKLLLPGNIFWNPDGSFESSDVHLIWQRACELGFVFLDAARSTPDISLHGIYESVKALNSEILAAVASETVIPLSSDHIVADELPRQSAIVDDAFMYGFVNNYIKKCQMVAAPEPVCKATEPDDEDVATVILSAQNVRDMLGKRIPDDVITETVVLGPPEPGQVPIQDRKTVADDVFSETVLLTPGQMYSGSAKGGGCNDVSTADTCSSSILHESDVDQLEETIVIRAPLQSAAFATSRVGTSVQQETAPERRPAVEDIDQLEETVVMMQPRRIGGAAVPPVSDRYNSNVPHTTKSLPLLTDQLEETVMLMPKKR